MWGTMIAQASGIYTLYLLLFWLPSYLQDTKHLTILKTGLYTAIPWAIAVPVSIVLGIVSDRLLKSETLLAGRRRAMVIFCVLLAAMVVFVPFTDNTTLILTLFALSLSGINAAISLNLALVTDLVHRARDVGKAISLTILSGNIFGLLAPIITGYVVAGLGAYDWAFGIAGIFLLIGALALATMTRSDPAGERSGTHRRGTRQEIAKFRMLGDIGAYESAARYHLEAAGAGALQRAGSELRRDLPARLRRRLGVQQRDHAAIDAIVYERRHAAGIELEAGRAVLSRTGMRPM